MKITYLGIIVGLGAGLTTSAPLVMAQGGQHRFRQQFHPHAQRQQRELERNGNVEREERQRRTTSNGTNERERQRENPNGTVMQQREQERTNAAGVTQTRSQERKIEPNP